MVVKVVGQTLYWYGMMAFVLFISAGTVDWLVAWAFLFQMVSTSLVCWFLLLKYDPELVEERSRSIFQEDQPVSDKFAVSLLLLTIFSSLALVGLDFRYGWSGDNLWVQVTGMGTLALASFIWFWAMASNGFASAVVKAQEDQWIVFTGPYNFIRHPQYLGTLIFMIGISLMFSSWTGLILVPITFFVLVFRVEVEEYTLSTYFDYDTYKKMVPHRLIPKVY